MDEPLEEVPLPKSVPENIKDILCFISMAFGSHSDISEVWEQASYPLGVLVALLSLCCSWDLQFGCSLWMAKGDEAAGTEQFLIPAPAAHLHMRMGVCSLRENSHQTQVCCVPERGSDSGLDFAQLCFRKKMAFSSGQEKSGTLSLLGPFPLQPPK